MGNSGNQQLRCDDVVKALATPHVGDDSSALAGHLTACPSCASWAKNDAVLMEFWDATQPAEPSAAAWDSTWNQISAGLDSVAQSTVLPISRASSWWTHKRAALLLTQAAAILLAVTLAWNRPWHTPVEIGNIGPLAQVTASEIEIPEGQFALIREDGGRLILHTIEIAQSDSANSVDRGYEFLADLESWAN